MTKKALLLAVFTAIALTVCAQQTPRRSHETEQLLECMQSVAGKKMLSGAMADVSWNLNEAKWVKRHTGKWPALCGFDYIHHPYSAQGGWIDYTDIDEITGWNRKGGVEPRPGIGRPPSGMRINAQFCACSNDNKKRKPRPHPMAEDGARVYFFSGRKRFRLRLGWSRHRCRLQLRRFRFRRA